MENVVLKCITWYKNNWRDAFDEVHNDDDVSSVLVVYRNMNILSIYYCYKCRYIYIYMYYHELVYHI